MRQNDSRARGDEGHQTSKKRKTNTHDVQLINIHTHRQWQPARDQKGFAPDAVLELKEVDTLLAFRQYVGLPSSTATTKSTPCVHAPVNTYVLRLPSTKGPHRIHHQLRPLPGPYIAS